MTTIKLKLSARRKSKLPRIRFDLEKLKDPAVAKVFQACIGGKFAALNLIDSDVDTMASEVKEVLLSSADEILGKRRRKIKPWVTDTVLDLCDKRRELRSQKHSSDEARAQYQQAHRAVRKKMAAAKEEWIEEQCNTIEKNIKSGNSKTAYNTLKNCRYRRPRRQASY